MRETVYQIGLAEHGYPLTIALVADLHGRHYTKVIRSLATRKPDIIAVAGDFMYGLVEFDRTRNQDIPMVLQSRDTLPFLSACAGIAPTYVSLGNHECFVWEDDIELIWNTGCILLENSWEKTAYNSANEAKSPLLIGGLTSARCTEFQLYRQARHLTDRFFVLQDEYIGDGKPATDWLDAFEAQKGYKLLLCHHPEYWEPYLKDRHIDLVLSGHAHGGQIRILGQGLFAPGQGILPKYTGGIHNGAYGKLVISRGLANTSRFIPRLFNRTELVYIQ